MDQKFKAILSYVVCLRPTWTTWTNLCHGPRAVSLVKQSHLHSIRAPIPTDDRKVIYKSRNAPTFTLCCREHIPVSQGSAGLRETFQVLPSRVGFMQGTTGLQSFGRSKGLEFQEEWKPQEASIVDLTVCTGVTQ